MSYHIVYTEDIKQVVSAVFIDARSVTMPLGINGVEVQELLDEQLLLITKNVIVYKIETEEGNLVGYFTVDVNVGQRTASANNPVLRVPFFANLGEIPVVIGRFMQQNLWQADFLF